MIYNVQLRLLKAQWHETTVFASHALASGSGSPDRRLWTPEAAYSSSKSNRSRPVSRPLQTPFAVVDLISIHFSCASASRVQVQHRLRLAGDASPLRHTATSSSELRQGHFVDMRHPRDFEERRHGHGPQLYEAFYDYGRMASREEVFERAWAARREPWGWQASPQSRRSSRRRTSRAWEPSKGRLKS